MDLTTISANLAATWSSVTPPTGLDAIVLSTDMPPNAITGTPTLLVAFPVGQFEYGAGGSLVGEWSFPVAFYVAKAADYRTQAKALRAWVSPLFAAVEANYDLNSPITGHTDVTLTDWQFVPLEYADQQYAGITFTARVRVSAGYNPTT